MDTPQVPASLLFEHYLEEGSDLISFPSDIARRRVAVVGNYTPQKCGIATFTGDLVEQLNRFRPELEIDVYALEGKGEDLCYACYARALMLSNLAFGMDPDERQARSMTYASFIQHAWNPGHPGFRNFMRFDRSWC